MSDICCGGGQPVAPQPVSVRQTDGTTTLTPVAPAVSATPPKPWYTNREILQALAAGVCLIVGWIAHPVGYIFYILALILGGALFVPQAITRLVRGPVRLTIGLLMTISAIGAIALGHVNEAASLAFLFSLAEALESHAFQRAKSDLGALMRLIPDTVTIATNPHPTVANARPEKKNTVDLSVGEILVAKPGERLATDGVVVDGSANLDLSAITGESMPVAAVVGDKVPAGAIVQTSPLLIQATADGTANSLTSIVAIVSQAQADKGKRARMADRIARPLVPAVLIAAALVAIIGSLLGNPDVWIERALVVLVAASPCALAIAVPVTIIAAVGAASQYGVIVTSGAAFERFSQTTKIAFDKTGTLTQGHPTVEAIKTVDGYCPGSLIAHAAAIEQHSTHPLAAAISAATRGTTDDDCAQTLPIVAGVEEIPGGGITGIIDGERWRVGNPRLVEPGPLADQVHHYEQSGHTVVVVATCCGVKGIIAIIDPLRPESPDTIRTLNDMGLDTIMLTGDNEATAKAIGEQAGIAPGNIHAELSPTDKAQSVTDSGWAMVGDGINDCPALAAADIGIAMGTTGTDAAIASADIAFTGHQLTLLPQALAHARRGRAIMNANIALALAVIIILPPLALTGLLGLAGVVLIHESAEVVIIANGLRAGRRKVLQK